MNKSKLLTSVIFMCLFVTSSLMGQQYTFKVLGAKGENFANGKSIKVGSTILASQTITLGKGGYLGLAHNSHKTLEITKPGTYKVSDLEKMVKTASNDLAGRYTQFLVNELTSGDDNGSRYNRRAKTGSVTRAILGKPILFYLPMDENGVSRTNKVLADSKITLKWYLNKGYDETSSNSYQLIVKDGSPEAIGDVIFKKDVKGNSIELDLTASAFQNRKVLLYQVIGENGKLVLESDEMMLVTLKGNVLKQIQTEATSLSKDKSALGKMVLGRFYEEKGLVANAIQAYEAALALSDLPTYRNYYHGFLNQYKIEPTVTAGK